MTIWISMMIFNVVEERENKYIIILYQYIYLFYLQYYYILAMSRYFEVLFHLLGAGVEEALSSRDKSLFFPLDTDEIGVKSKVRAREEG